MKNPDASIYPTDVKIFDTNPDVLKEMSEAMKKIFIAALLVNCFSSLALAQNPVKEEPFCFGKEKAANGLSLTIQQKLTIPQPTQRPENSPRPNSDNGDFNGWSTQYISESIYIVDGTIYQAHTVRGNSYQVIGSNEIRHENPIDYLTNLTTGEKLDPKKFFASLQKWNNKESKFLTLKDYCISDVPSQHLSCPLTLGVGTSFSGRCYSKETEIFGMSFADLMDGGFYGSIGCHFSGGAVDANRIRNILGSSLKIENLESVIPVQVQSAFSSDLAVPVSAAAEN